jgi:T5SS/PEP-CTERM-associated repeat protein/autotransporter-associated beta strand protein
MAEPRARAARRRQSLGAVRGLIEIAAPRLPRSFGAFCRLARTATGAWHRRFKPCIFSLLWILLIIRPAYAAVILDAQFRAVEGCTGVPLTERCEFLVISEHSLPFTAGFNGAVSFGGVAQQMSVVNVPSGSEILRGASGSGSIVDGGMSTKVTSLFQIIFRVIDNPTRVSLHTEMTGTTPTASEGGVNFNFFGPGQILFNNRGTFSGTFEGELDVGNYQFNIQALGRGTGAGPQSWEFDLDFPPHWLNPVDGTFSDGAKWNSGAAPSGMDSAVIGKAGTYTVTLDRNAAHKRLDVKGDGANVTLDLDGHRYELDELNLGDPSGNFSFTLADSGGIVVAVPPGDGGPWPAPGTGEAEVKKLTGKGQGNTTITAKTTTTVGLVEDRHVLDVKGDGEWQVDSLTVGDEKAATLEILGGGKVNNTVAHIGALTRDVMTTSKVIVSGQGSKFESTDMIVGVNGRGRLEISARGDVAPTNLTVGDGTDGDGVVTVDGQNTRLHSSNGIDIAVKGRGELQVLNRASVFTGGDLVIGGGNNVNTFGTVVVSAEGIVTALGELRVGGEIVGDGILSAVFGGKVRTDRARIQHRGVVRVSFGGFLGVGSVLTVDGRLEVATTGTALVGTEALPFPNGFLTIGPGGTLKGNGTIAANVNLAGGSPQFTGSTLAPANSTGTLTIEGDLEQAAGSALEIEIGGTGAGAFDVVKVTGDATLAGDVFLKFTDGFAPRQGQQFEFLDVTGTLSGSFANVALRNLAPGFQFDLSRAGGGMTMMALNDGEFRLPTSTAWNEDASGNWASVANWTDGDPNHAGATAVLGNKITAPRRVTVDEPVTVGRIDFDNAHAYTISGESAITVDATTGDAQIKVTSGSHTISAPVSLADNTVVNVSPAGSSLSLTGALSAGAVNVTKAGAGRLTLANLQAGGLTIDQGTVAMSPGGTDATTSVVGALSIAGGAAPTAKLDLNDNAAIVNYSGASPAATIRQQVLAGRGGPGFGATWAGQGITSSAAAAANVTEAESRSLGFADNSALPLGAYTIFRGQPVDGTSILIGFTRTGDANLDGVVNDDDVTIVGASYAPGAPQASWALGDFDYNGFVDDDDITLLGAFYDPSAPPLAVTPAEAVAAVPEPASRLFALGALVLFASRAFLKCTSLRAAGVTPDALVRGR